MHQAAALYARSLLELAIEKDQKSVQQRNLSQVQVSSKQGRYMLLPLSQNTTSFSRLKYPSRSEVSSF
jgi:hypothetical protein